MYDLVTNRFNSQPSRFKIIFVLGVVATLLCVVFDFVSKTTTEQIPNCEVITTIALSKINGSATNLNTEIIYLVVTNKETFICEESALNGSLNNVDMFYRIKKDSTYTFKVAGFGKTVFSDYRNIIGLQKQ